jgi:Spy/CpxP family protein refolding chaperone
MRESRVKSLTAMAPLALLAALALLALPALALAGADQAGADHAAMSAQAFGDHLQMMAKKLNLTEEQQASAKLLFQDFQAKIAPLHQAQQTLHTQLKAALAAANPDAATVGQAVIQLHQNRAQMKPLMEAFHQQLEALLTPEQLAKFKQMHANHSSFRHHWDASPSSSQ